MKNVLGNMYLGIVALAFAGCDTPESNTGLRPEGPPDVLTVMGLTRDYNDATGNPLERAVFCKADDEKVPRLIVSGAVICPRPGFEDPAPSADINADRGDVNGTAQFRIVFDELLNPDAVEELLDEDGNPGCDSFTENCTGSIANTNPVDVTCDGTAVAYDGYYAPNGNNVTNPPGPSLVVTFDATAAQAGSPCSITLKDTIIDKSGEVVPADQRGPFTFNLPAFEFAGTDPVGTDAEPAVVEADGVVAFLFSYPVDGGSIDAGEVTLMRDGMPVAGAVATADGAAIVFAGQDAMETPFVPGEYVATITAGSTFAELAGSTTTVDADQTIHFTVMPPAPFTKGE